MKLTILPAQENVGTLPKKDLILVTGRSTKILAAEFGPNFHQANLREIEQEYNHSQEYPVITFRGPSTQESLKIASQRFEARAKQFLDANCTLQLGKVVITEDGIYTNMTETNPYALKRKLNNIMSIRGIYLINDTQAFIPYEAFWVGKYKNEDFVRSALARGLEHTDQRRAKSLEDIASKSHYPNGVLVKLFHPEGSNPTVNLVELEAGTMSDAGALTLNFAKKNQSSDFPRKGYTFGILK